MNSTTTPPTLSPAANHLDGPADNLLLAAFNGHEVKRPGVWMMRQAGRYMPEYQAIRGKVDFMTLCKTPDLAVEVSLQPWRAFGMDAVIMFSDILIPVEAMGVPVTFEEKRGPVLPNPLRHTDALPTLKTPDPTTDTAFVLTILQRLRQTLNADKSAAPPTALVGFAGAPWTMATYMIEGGSSRHFTHLKRWMWEQPESLHHLLQHTTTVIIDYLRAQVAAGAQIIQLFDTWAGLLTPAQYEVFALPYQQQIFEALKPTPTMLYIQQSRHLIPLMAKCGASGLSLDWMTPISEARQTVGPDMVLQGNLDPVALYTTPNDLTPMVNSIVAEGMQTPNRYVFNLGHGILPQTPVDNVRHVVDMVKSWTP
jgi:uroporphyrinogen decarboxylase